MRNLMLITSILALFACNNASTGFKPGVKIHKVKKADISLNGTWKLSLDPPEDFYKNNVLTELWQDAEVPNELLAQGFMIEMDKPFVYKRQIDIPKDFAGHRILINFKAVNNLAKVYVNGKHVTTHQGGFTEWHCDITGFVEPGRTAWLTVEVTNISREISLNGKAQRPTGGIVGDLILQARPETNQSFK
jgi:beta-galactosidase/beta-glucuronidase